MEDSTKAAFIKCAEIAEERSRSLRLNREEVRTDAATELGKLAKQFREAAQSMSDKPNAESLVAYWRNEAKIVSHGDEVGDLIALPFRDIAKATADFIENQGETIQSIRLEMASIAVAVGRSNADGFDVDWFQLAAEVRETIARYKALVLEAGSDPDKVNENREWVRSTLLDDLQKKIADLVALLKPFSDAAAKAEERQEQSERIGMGKLSGEASPGLGIKFKHLFAARDALKKVWVGA